jgi:stage III sporulation protein AH
MEVLNVNMKMNINMKNWKKNMVAAAVLLVVCAGIYMNWIYTNAEDVADLTDKLDSDKVMSDDSLILEVGGNKDDVVDTVTDYFAAVRLSRQQARDSAVELLQEAMSYTDGSDPTTVAQLEEIVQMALAEAQIESLVIAKGYADCVAYMSDTGISVAVASPEGGMKEADIAVIADIILSQTEFTYKDIRIVDVQ